MATIVRLRQADEDLIAIWRFLADFDPGAADRMLDAIERRWNVLVAHPSAGPARDDLAPGLRQLVSGPYLILYRVVGDVVEIVRVLHGRMRLEAQRFVASDLPDLKGQI